MGTVVSTRLSVALKATVMSALKVVVILVALKTTVGINVNPTVDRILVSHSVADPHFRVNNVSTVWRTHK